MSLHHVNFSPWVGALSRGNVSLDYTAHARERCRLKGLPRYLCLDIKAGSCFEAETNSSGMVVKIGVRVPRANGWDLCFILKPKPGGDWLVITCWANASTDTHKTLDFRRYKIA